MPGCDPHGFETGTPARFDIARSVANHENVLGRHRADALHGGCFGGLSDQSRSIFGIRTETAEFEVLIQIRAIEFDPGAQFDVTGRQTEHDVGTCRHFGKDVGNSGQDMVPLGCQDFIF